MMEFFKQNILLIGLALGSGAMLLWPMLKRGTSGVADVSPNDAVLLINREHATVLDVRNANEYATGHITEALHIPLAELESRLAELAKYKDKPLLVNCQGGVRSASACGILTKAGFTKLYNLEGGVNDQGSLMPRILMYSTAVCPYCINAERLLASKGVTAIDKVRVDLDPARRAEMMERSGRRTVPQIWIGERHVGGFDELRALDMAGELDQLLAG